MQLEEDEKRGAADAHSAHDSGSSVGSRSGRSGFLGLLLFAMIMLLVLGALMFFSGSSDPSDWANLILDGANWLSGTATLF